MEKAKPSDLSWRALVMETWPCERSFREEGGEEAQDKEEEVRT